jgi:hypothetical protein
VRNTGGMWEERPVVETLLRLGPVTRLVRLTVACRTHMIYPVILGRTALAGAFVVDAGRKFVLGRKKPN